MNELPLVSICIPIYNGEAHLREALDSAVQQSYENLEIIIVDDCSEDSSMMIAREYSQSYSNVRVHKNATRLGLVGNWNRCIASASGEWIKFLFQDDLLHEHCVELMVRAALDSSEDPRVVFCRRSYLFENDKYSMGLRETLGKGANIWDIYPGKTTFSLPDTFRSIDEKIYHNYFGEPPSFLIHREVYEKVGNYDSAFIQLCDVEFNLRLLANYRLLHVPQVLFTFRVHSDSTSSGNVSSKRFQVRYLERVKIFYQLHGSTQLVQFRNYLVFRPIKGYYLMRAGLLLRRARLEARKHGGSAWMNEYQNFVREYPELEIYSEKNFIELALRYFTLEFAKFVVLGIKRLLLINQRSD